MSEETHFYSHRSTWRPSAEFQIIIDIARQSWRRLFERSWMSKMTIEEAIAEYKKEGMYCTNLYERREGGWMCFLRFTSNGLLAESGFGADAQEAIFQALRKAKKDGFSNRDLPPPKHLGLGLAGEKNEAQLVRYGSPLTDELPRDLGATDQELGISPSEGPEASDAEFDALPDDDDLLGPAPAQDDLANEFF